MIFHNRLLMITKIGRTIKMCNLIIGLTVDEAKILCRALTCLNASDIKDEFLQQTIDLHLDLLQKISVIEKCALP